VLVKCALLRTFVVPVYVVKYSILRTCRPRMYVVNLSNQRRITEASSGREKLLGFSCPVRDLPRPYYVHIPFRDGVRRTTEHVMYVVTSFMCDLWRLVCLFSKLGRSVPGFAWHGDFRGYLYEALVISICCPMRHGKYG